MSSPSTALAHLRAHSCISLESGTVPRRRLALFAILRLTNWSGADFGAILLYSLIAGNLLFFASDKPARPGLRDFEARMIGLPTNRV
jgi:hypothetical protein